MIPPIDVITTTVAALLTLFVFGYLLGDLPGLGALFKFLYRLAMHVLIGAGVAYAFAVAMWSIIFQRVAVRLVQFAAEFTRVGFQISQVSPEGWFNLSVPAVGVVLGGLLLFKLSRSTAWLGNLATSYLVGVGLAVALGGALIGTLFAQIRATSQAGITFTLLDPLIVLVGTLTALVAFTFTATARRGVLGVVSRGVQGVGVLGRLFVYLALGAAFAGAYAASVAVLVGRLQFLIEALETIVGYFLGG